MTRNFFFLPVLCLSIAALLFTGCGEKQEATSKYSAEDLLEDNLAERPAEFSGKVVLPGNVPMEFVQIQPGTFQMGNAESADAREVTIEPGFWMAKFEVTQNQWKALMQSEPFCLKEPEGPADSVSLYDALAFCEKLNKRHAKDLPAGYAFVIPTEEQWEYACRAGETGAYCGGDLNAVGWYAQNSEDKIHPVGQKKANAWGLYDMQGNVWEWCLKDPTATDAPVYVMRGGGWGNLPDMCCTWTCIEADSMYNFGSRGFRIACIPLAK